MPRKQSNITRLLKRTAIVGGLSCLAILAAAALWRHAHTATHVVTYRLLPDQGPVTEQQLAETSAIVQARLKQLARAHRLAGCRVEALPQDRLRVSLRTHTDPAEALAWASMQGRAELALLHPDPDVLKTLAPDEAPEGYRLATYREKKYSLGRPGNLVTYEHTYLVRDEPLLRVARFESVRLDLVGLAKQTVLTFTFDQQQRKDFEALTALNVGRRMAMFIDGELFFPPKKIPSAVPGGVVQVQGYFYNPPLRSLVGALTAGTLPGRLEEISHEVQ